MPDHVSVRNLQANDIYCTLAPAATALRTSIWHWARLAVMLAVEHNCPTAYRVNKKLVANLRVAPLFFVILRTPYCNNHIRLIKT